MAVKYFVLAGDYDVFIRECIKERLWIKMQRKWWGPYDWAWRFGISWMGFNFVPHLGDPIEMIAEARKKDLTENQIVSVNNFEKRVKEYYLSGKDEKLLKSMETGIWVF